MVADSVSYGSRMWRPRSSFIGLSIMAYYIIVATAPAITVQVKRNNMKMKEFLPSETLSFIELPFLIDYFRRLGNVTFYMGTLYLQMKSRFCE